MSVMLFEREKIQKLSAMVDFHAETLEQGITHTEAFKHLLSERIVFSDNTQTAAQIYDAAKKEAVGRTIWYNYIANVTAYNVQYRENAPILYDLEDVPPQYCTKSDLASELSHLSYNTFTNDGNYFVADRYKDALDTMIEILKQSRD